jgi:hypothetical protein
MSLEQTTLVPIGLAVNKFLRGFTFLYWFLVPNQVPGMQSVSYPDRQQPQKSRNRIASNVFKVLQV